MPAREAVKLVADAMEANLQAKLDALSVVSGESAPTIAEFRDEYSDNEPTNSRNHPLVVTMVEDRQAAAEFQSFARSRTDVPLTCAFMTFARDRRTARRQASYAYRGMLQVLSDLELTGTSSRTVNSVLLIQFSDPAPLWMEAEDEPGMLLLLRFTAKMEDQSV